MTFQCLYIFLLLLRLLNTLHQGFLQSLFHFPKFQSLCIQIGFMLGIPIQLFDATIHYKHFTVSLSSK